VAFEEVAGDDEAPHEGDFIFLKYSERIMQIAEVKDDANIFLENKFSYKLILRAADITGEEVTPNIGIDDLEDFAPDLDDTEIISDAADAIVVEKPDDLSPFGEWG